MVASYAIAIAHSSPQSPLRTTRASPGVGTITCTCRTMCRTAHSNIVVVVQSHPSRSTVVVETCCDRSAVVVHSEHTRSTALGSMPRSEIGLAPGTSGPPCFEMSVKYALSLLVELSRVLGLADICLVFPKRPGGAAGEDLEGLGRDWRTFKKGLEGSSGDTLRASERRVERDYTPRFRQCTA